jgi:hypothetical protein
MVKSVENMSIACEASISSNCNQFVTMVSPMERRKLAKMLRIRRRKTV